MQVLILPFYHGLGHVIRAARVGKELSNRGVGVTLAAAKDALSIGKDLGLECVALDELPPFPPRAKAFSNPGPAGPLRLADPGYLSRALEQERTLIREIQPDFVLVDFRVTGAISAQLEGVPAGWIVNTGFFSHPLPSVLHEVVPALEDLGIPSSIAENLFGDYLYIPDWPNFEPVNQVFHETDIKRFSGLREIRHVGPIIKNSVENLPDKSTARSILGVSEEEKLVFISLGGSSQGYPYLLDIVPQLHELDLNARVVVGPNIPLSEFEGSEKVQVVQYEDRPLLWLSAADVAVTHGGHTTTMEALTVGTPVLVIPGHREQEKTAEFVKRNVIGSVIKPQDLPTKFSHELHQVLESAFFRQNLEPLAQVLRASDGAVETAEHIIRTHLMRSWV